MKWLMFLALLGPGNQWETIGTVSDYVYYSQYLCEYEARERTSWATLNPREEPAARERFRMGRARYICVQESEKYSAGPYAIPRKP